MCSALYTVNLNLVGIFVGGGGGGCVPNFFPDRRFYSGQPILHFIYLNNLMGLLIGQK